MKIKIIMELDVVSTIDHLNLNEATASTVVLNKIRSKIGMAMVNNYINRDLDEDAIRIDGIKVRPLSCGLVIDAKEGTNV